LLRIICSASIQQVIHLEFCFMSFRSIQHGLSLCIPAHQPLCSVGIELQEEEAFLTPTSSPIIQGRKKQQQLQDQSFPDYVISFRQTFPLHVYDVCAAAHPDPVLTFSHFRYNKLAEEVASYSLGENAR
jgi:hypothetical protein